MSVINTMLKDLERRGVDCANSDDNILGGLSANNAFVHAEDNSNNIYLVSLISVILILVVITAVYYLSPYQLVSAGSEQPKVELANSEVTETIPTKVTENTQGQLIKTKPASTQNNQLLVTTAQTKTKQLEIQEVEVTQTAINSNNTADNAVLIKTAAKPPVIAPIKKVRPIANQQKMVIVNSEPVNIEEPATDELDVINKKQRETSDEEKSQLAYVGARTLYDRGRTQRSKALLQEALNFNSGNKEAYSLLSVIYLEDGRPGLASEVIKQGLSVHAGDQDLLRLYLQAHVQSGKYKEAAVIMEKHLRLITPEDLGYLAGLYQKNNDHLNAVKLYSQALQLNPSKSIWWMGQGISFERMKKYGDALQSYKQSINTGQLSGTLSQYTTNRIKSLKHLNVESVS